MDKAFATETVDSVLIPGWMKRKACIQIVIHSFPAWCSAIKRTMWNLGWKTGDSLTWRPKGLFAVSWPRHLGKYNVITIIGFTGHSTQGFHCWRKCWKKPKMHSHQIWSFCVFVWKWRLERFLRVAVFNLLRSSKWTIFLLLQCCHFASIVTKD